MQYTNALGRLLFKTATLAFSLWYLCTHIVADNVPPWMRAHAAALALSTSLAIFFVDGTMIYPNFRDPYRKLPTISQGALADIYVMKESPRGATSLRWINDHTGADVLCVRGAFNIPRLVLVSPRVLKDVFSTNSYDFEKPYGIRAFLARIIGFGLILSEGAAHKKQRKALTPSFNIKKIRELYGLMWEKTQILLDELQKDIDAHPASYKYADEKAGVGLVEISEWGSRLTLDVIGPTAMGRDFDSMRNAENRVADAFIEVLEPTRYRVFFLALHFIVPQALIRLVPGPVNLMINRIQAYLRNLCLDIVKEKKGEMLDDKESAEHDVLGSIMKTNEFSDDELVDQMLTLLAAGHETTASALTWGCYMLAHNPDIQTKLRNEIRASIPSSASPITWDLLEGMPYLNGVCNEILRLYPTVPTTIREVVRDTTVAGVPVARDTLLLIVPYAVNRAQEAWGDNANEMVPERWIDTAPNGSQRPNKNGGAPSNLSEITFLHGSRSCIGRDFAKAELRCAIAGVAGKFEIRMEDPNMKHTISGVITTKAMEGMHLKMKHVEGW